MRSVPYLYTLQEDFTAVVPFLLPAFRNKWGEIVPDPAAGTSRITIRKGYAWDGCSFKLFLPGWLGRHRYWFGTPEGPVDPATGRARTYFASLVHDFLYQFRREICAAAGCTWPQLKDKADRCFKVLLDRSAWWAAGVYYLAVRWFGGWYARR